jgi:F0F1-type ATP synthase membrane subunit b/b'
MTSEQINGFQAKVQEQLKDAQAKAASRAKELEAEARKAFQHLGEKAQVEIKGWLSHAELSSRESLHAIGAELVKLGKRLQEVGKQVEAKADEPKAEEPHAQA